MVLGVLVGGGKGAETEWASCVSPRGLWKNSGLHARAVRTWNLVHYLVEALCLTATCSESVYCRVEHGILVFWEMTSRDPLG